MPETGYWDRYYQSQQQPGVLVPSQFATFVASEFLGAATHIVDIGCGNGRDTVFFGRQGFKVLGVDGSSQAVALCRKKARSEDVEFLCNEVSDPLLSEKLRAFVLGAPVVFYARFFLHAIDEAAEAAFLRAVRSACGSTDSVAVEFRTKRDEAQAKVTPNHYRRFIDPMDFMEAAHKAGFRISYYVEGFGYAKFRNDDAHVARFILTQSAT